MILSNLHNRTKEIETLLDNAEGEAADVLFAELFKLEDEIHRIELSDEEAATQDYNEYVRQASAPQHYFI